MRIDIVYYDLETTGVDTKTAGVVQIGAIYSKFDSSGGLSNGKFSDTTVLMNTLVNPGHPIPEGASEVHGIYDKDVKSSPTEDVAVRTFAVMLDKIKQDSDCLMLCGYNSIGYDMQILDRVNGGGFSHPHMDVYAIVLRYLSDHGLKLSAAYESYVGEESVDAHDAVADVKMVARILEKYCGEVDRTPVQVLGDLSIPKAYKVMPFGKHIGKPIASVPSGYARWCLQNFDNMSPDLRLTLRKIAGKNG